MSNDPIKRARFQSQHGPRFPVGMCALDVRGLYDAPSSGDADSDGDADAVDVFLRCPAVDRHRVSLEALDAGVQLPRGVPFVFAGGSSGHGHIVITTGFHRGWDSIVWSPDTLRSGYFDRVTIRKILTWMSHGTPLGWVEQLGGQRIYWPTPLEGNPR